MLSCLSLPSTVVEGETLGGGGWTSLEKGFESCILSPVQK